MAFPFIPFQKRDSTVANAKTFWYCLFLVFGVPNAKYLAFDTLDGNALRAANFIY